ncbi:MAG: C40 family peptidase [Chitinophagaceae bacterium]|nr:C40 family peptidase [Chitinophagaceae bacterium]
MAKQLIPAIAVMLFLSSCTAFKSLNLSNNRKTASSVAPASSQSKFIEDISITPQSTIDKTQVKLVPKTIPPTHDRSTEVVVPTVVKEEPKPQASLVANRTTEVENASAVQLKYAILLNTEVEYLPNKTLLESVDEWYGVRYRTGGNTKTGVDCSGFTVAVYSAVYGIALPRVSREQYRISRKISITELQEGDLVFFRTRGSGVSHVGVYLGNNKFIHASVSRGVMVNSLFESYYVQRFIGAGRIDDKEIAASSN